MNRFLESIQEGNGDISSIRIMVCVVILTILFNWTWYNLKNDKFAPLDFGEMASIVGVLLAKAVQKKYEAVAPVDSKEEGDV